MAYTFSRQSSFSNGDVIDASLFNAEFDQLVAVSGAAFNEATGHSHDGSAENGGLIPLIKKENTSVSIDTSDSDNHKIVFTLDGNVFRTFSEEEGDALLDTQYFTHTPNGGSEVFLNTYLDTLETAVGDASLDAASAAESADRAEAAAAALGVPIILQDGDSYTIPTDSVITDLICLGSATINFPSTLTVGHRYSIRCSSKASDTSEVLLNNPSYSIIGDVLTLPPGDNLVLRRHDLAVLDVISASELEII